MMLHQAGQRAQHTTNELFRPTVNVSHLHLDDGLHEIKSSFSPETEVCILCTILALILRGSLDVIDRKTAVHRRPFCGH